MGPSLGLSVLWRFAEKTGEPTHDRLQLGGRKMNPYRIRTIIEHIRDNGSLPTDQFGTILDADDVLVWFGLTRRLTPAEQNVIKNELRMMAEAQHLADQLKSGLYAGIAAYLGGLPLPAASPSSQTFPKTLFPSGPARYARH